VFIDRASIASFVLFPAEFFGAPDEKRVVFVKKPRIGSQVPCKDLLGIIIIAGLFEHSMTAQNAPRIAIDDKNRFLERIKKNRISGFGAYAVDGQKLLPQNFRVFTLHAF
jgi:hypothetical protein